MASTYPAPDGIAGRVFGYTGGFFTAKSGVDGKPVEAISPNASHWLGRGCRRSVVGNGRVP